MEYIDVIIKLISNLGFPIVCCIVLFVQNNNFSKALNELSTTLQLMNERLEDIEQKVG